jgi:hypothetical protein
MSQVERPKKKKNTLCVSKDQMGLLALFECLMAYKNAAVKTIPRKILPELKG